MSNRKLIYDDQSHGWQWWLSVNPDGEQIYSLYSDGELVKRFRRHELERILEAGDET